MDACEIPNDSVTLMLSEVLWNSWEHPALQLCVFYCGVKIIGQLLAPQWKKKEKKNEPAKCLSVPCHVMFCHTAKEHLLMINFSNFTAHSQHSPPQHSPFSSILGTQRYTACVE